LQLAADQAIAFSRLQEFREVIATDVNNTSSTLETDIFLTSLKM
jgi:hypothetical protein